MAALLGEGGMQEKGEHARLSSFVGATAISDLVKTTLGPRGMDKILQSTSHPAEVHVTNDGATILKSIYIDNPAARVLVDISKTQDAEVGDGTTSVAVLAGELLREAEKLISQKIHPQTIIEGWRMATQAAKGALEKSATTNKADPEKFRQDLIKIAKTTLSSKILSQERDHFAEICVNAVLRLKGSTDLDRIAIIKKTGGTLRESFLDEGFILEKKFGVGQPKRIENAKILIANTAMDTDKVKIFGSRIRTDSTQKVEEMEKYERERMLEKCEKIAKHNINCFVNRQLIYNLAEEYFTSKGIGAIEHADFDGVERLALVTGGEIVSQFDAPDTVKLGTCKLIEEIFIGEDKVIRFSGCPVGEACTIVLRGATTNILDEAERSIHDALCVISQTVVESRTVWGAGCSETLMAQAVFELARHTEGKRALAIDAFGRALLMLPTIICDNAGYDSSDLVSQLKAAHYSGKATAGINIESGTIGDAQELGVLESFKVKIGILLNASEAAEMLLRVDNIIRAPPRKREGH